VGVGVGVATPQSRRQVYLQTPSTQAALQPLTGSEPQALLQVLQFPMVEKPQLKGSLQAVHWLLSLHTEVLGQKGD